MTTIVHVVNQFFAGFGGEEKAGMSVGVIEEAAGAARGLQSQLGAETKVACTSIVRKPSRQSSKRFALEGRKR
jgi:hypothetical protein